MTHSSLLAGAVVAAWLSGCAAAPTTRPASSHTAAARHDHASPAAAADTCPMQLPGTRVAATEIGDGAVLTFTNPGAVEALRQRVERMAGMHNRHHGEESVGTNGAHGAGSVPPSTAATEDVDGGVRLILQPRDPADLDALREHARAQAEKMARGECPMMPGSAPTASGDPQR